jgi:hypothetical protein
VSRQHHPQQRRAGARGGEDEDGGRVFGGGRGLGRGCAYQFPHPRDLDGTDRAGRDGFIFVAPPGRRDFITDRSGRRGRVVLRQVGGQRRDGRGLEKSDHVDEVAEALL